jgi:hypothetical protein
MKNIQIQIQQNPANKSFLRIVNGLLGLPDVKTIRFDKGRKNQNYINIFFPVRSVKNTWAAIGPMIKKDKIISRSSIVVCEGKFGWDDYELIYHWDVDKIDKKWRKSV